MGFGNINSPLLCPLPHRIRWVTWCVGEGRGRGGRRGAKQGCQHGRHERCWAVPKIFARGSDTPPPDSDDCTIPQGRRQLEAATAAALLRPLLCARRSMRTLRLRMDPRGMWRFGGRCRQIRAEQRWCSNHPAAAGGGGQALGVSAWRFVGEYQWVIKI